MNRFNRVLWILIGLVLTAAGVVGVLARFNVMPGIRRDQAVITPGMDARWRSWDGWTTGVIIAVGLLLAAAGAWLFLAQFRRRGGAMMTDLSQPAIRTEPTSDSGDGHRHEAGRTRVATSTLNQALSRDLQRNGRVRRAAVRLTGERNQPNLRMHLAVSPDADIVDLRRHVDRAVERLRNTSGLNPNVAEVIVNMSNTQRERVR